LRSRCIGAPGQVLVGRGPRLARQLQLLIEQRIRDEERTLRATERLVHPRQHLPYARIISQRPWFFGASTEWPGVVPTEDVEFGDTGALAASHPDVAAAASRCRSHGSRQFMLSPSFLSLRSV
jgi:hypothetical protein